MRVSGITYFTPQKRSFRKPLKIVLLAVVLVLFLIAGISGYTAWLITHPDRTEPGSIPGGLDGASEVTFNDSSGKYSLNGWFFAAEGGTGVIITVHGHGGNRLIFRDATSKFIGEMQSSGWSVLAFDLRNSGNSGGNISSLGYNERNDVLSAVNYVKKLDYENIVLLGCSTGASASLFASALSPDVDAVVADTPYHDMRTFLYDTLRTYTRLPSFPFDFAVPVMVNLFAGIDSYKIAAGGSDTIAKRDLPVLFIHSSRDSLIPIAASKKLLSLYSVGSARCRLWETDATGHASSFVQLEQSYVLNVSRFLMEIFGDNSLSDEP